MVEMRINLKFVFAQYPQTWKPFMILSKKLRRNGVKNGTD